MALNNNGFKFDWKGSELGRSLEDALEEVEFRVNARLDLEARDLQSLMQENRPWTDRTGRAKTGLQTTVTNEGKFFRITLMHTVEYGQWLEFAREEKYAIIKPTIIMEKSRIVKGLKGIINDVFW